ncbi:MAG: class I fructose-bisphosphate aldolase family protein [Deltaproteobacteria bacterium]|nr:class I fructose-bisphosphate aldolase family protein [Deltaproteobacteria bacterium]
MNIGKSIRLERIIDRNSGKTVIIPMDHGISIGPVEGLIDWKSTINAVAEGGANAIVIHKGLVETGHRRSGKDVGLIIHMSASTSLAPDPNSKVLVCKIEEAIRLGADAISIHINMGSEDEKGMLTDFGMVSREARIWGIPLLAMMYTRGPKIKNQYDPALVKHAARVGAELGADIVKVPYTGSPDTFRQVVEGCFVPVVIAGGEKMDTDEDVLQMVKGCVDAGGAGVSIGRNVFQHRSPTKIVKAISKIVHNGVFVQEALKILGGD